ncbi:hypothetical protein [Pigmentiphaga daeguensis]|uniref:Uncharacterized protein n=1 Tax=Pigmentiphaga daeguensis TaxID=414049 RepID=A0ABP3N298_9BURK
MEAKHTPGPWELRDEFGMQGLVYAQGLEYPVASTTGYYNRAGQTEHNARLIAAAPELLEALRDVVRAEMFLPDHPQRQAAYATARAAIAKATA